MADRQFVVCPLLCFLVNKFGRLDSRQLKSLVAEFYTLEEIVAAKEQLINDVSGPDFIDIIPRLPNRHGEGRHAREVNDIFTVFNILDERKLLCELPKYVVDKTDVMPSARLMEGDLKCLIFLFEKLEGKVDMYRDQVSALTKSMHDVLGTSVPVQRVINKSVINEQPSGLSSSSRNVNNRVDLDSVHKHSVIDWAAERDILSTESESCDEVGGWNVVESHRQKRRRQSSAKAATGQSVTDDSRVFGQVSYTPSLAVDNNRPGKLTYSMVTAKDSNVNSKTLNKSRTAKRLPMIVGNKSTDVSSPSSTRITAAKPYISKVVYCIDNVSESVDEDDMKDFVIKHGVQVLSCHLVKPRRSRWQRESGIIPTGRHTFRLCVPREQSSHLLKPDFWPSHITISPWVFSKSPKLEVGGSLNTDRLNLINASTERNRQKNENAAKDILNSTVVNNSPVNDPSGPPGPSSDMETTITDYNDEQS